MFVSVIDPKGFCRPRQFGMPLPAIARGKPAAKSACNYLSLKDFIAGNDRFVLACAGVPYSPTFYCDCRVSR